MSGSDGPDRPGVPARPASGSRPGRRALFSGPYDSGLATGQGGEPEGQPAGPARRSASGGPPPEPPAGRRAFFSDTSGRAGPTGRPGAAFDDTEVRPGLTTVVVECRTCLQRTPMSLVGLGLSLVPSLWLPTRPWPRLMRCPACRRVSWCRIEWPSLRG